MLTRFGSSALVTAALFLGPVPLHAAPYVDVVTATQLLSYDLGDGNSVETVDYELEEGYEGYTVVGIDFDVLSVELLNGSPVEGELQLWMLASNPTGLCRLFTLDTAPEPGATLVFEATEIAFDCPGPAPELEVIVGGNAFIIVAGDAALSIQLDEDEGGLATLTVEGQPADIRGTADMSEEIFGADRLYAVDAASGTLIDYSEALEAGENPYDGQIVGALGVPLSGAVSFEIGGFGSEPLPVLLAGGNLYSVNLETGTASLLFAAPPGAIAAAAEPFVDDGDGGDGGDGGDDGDGSDDGGDGSGDGGDGDGGDGSGDGGDGDDDDDGGSIGLGLLSALAAAALMRGRRRRPLL